jgi:hypothetical protein
MTQIKRINADKICILNYHLHGVKGKITAIAKITKDKKYEKT